MYGKVAFLALSLGLLVCGLPSRACAQSSDLDLGSAVDLPRLRSYTLARNRARADSAALSRLRGRSGAPGSSTPANTISNQSRSIGCGVNLTGASSTAGFLEARARAKGAGRSVSRVTRSPWQPKPCATFEKSTDVRRVPIRAFPKTFSIGRYMPHALSLQTTLITTSP